MNMRIEFYIKGRPRLKKPHHLKGIGLPDVYLLNGVKVENDITYGELVTIDDISGLHRAIGFHLLMKPTNLTGDEVRFLRKQMRLSQEKMAERLKVDVQTVANHEKGVTKKLGPVELLVRFQFAMHILPREVHGDFARKLMDALAASEPKPPVPEAVRRKVAGKWHDDGSLHAN